MDLTKLKDKFKPSEIEWRVERCGKKNTGDVWCMVLAYVTNRAIQNRLDDVCGPMNWNNEFRTWHDVSQLCGISIYNKDTGEWITKYDGSDNTTYESTKGGLSSAMKRAAVQWGIGRYLYELDVTFAKTSTTKIDGWNYTNDNPKDRKGIGKFWWETPELPTWALPDGWKGQPYIPIQNKPVEVDQEKLNKLKKLCSKGDDETYNTAQTRQNYNELIKKCLERYPECEKFSNIFIAHGDDIISELDASSIDAFLTDRPW